MIQVSHGKLERYPIRVRRRHLVQETEQGDAVSPARDGDHPAAPE
jgi:hypothetical protein